MRGSGRSWRESLSVPLFAVTFTGRVTEVCEEGGTGLVRCEVTGTNQREQVVARARATVPFSL